MNYEAKFKKKMFEISDQYKYDYAIPTYKDSFTAFKIGFESLMPLLLDAIATFQGCEDIWARNSFLSKVNSFLDEKKGDGV